MKRLMSRPPRLATTLLLLALPAYAADTATPPTAAATEEKHPHQLGEMVVTASRTDRPTNTIPASVTVITAEDIARTNAQTVPDLIRFESGIDVKDFFGTGRTTVVDVRGFGEVANANTLVLVDGRRVNPADISAVDWTTIPLERIDRIEIVRGGGGVLYGDNAVGGIVNIRTKKGAPATTVTSTTEAGSYSLFGQRLGIAGSEGPLTYAANGSYAETDGYRDNGYLRNKATGLSLGYDDGREFGVDLSAGTKEDRYGMPGARAPGQDRRGTASPQNFAETENSYVLLTPKLRPGDDVELSLGMDYSDTNYFSHFAGAFGGDIEWRIPEYGVSPKITFKPELCGLENEVVAGVDFHRADRHELKSSPFFALGDIRRDETGYYLNDTLTLVPDKLFLDAGYRFSKVTYDYGRSVTPTPNDASSRDGSYRAGLTYAYAAQSKAFLAYDRSVRNQLVDEISALPNPRVLAPQLADQYQAGIRHHFCPLLTTGATLFQIDTQDEIFFDPDPTLGSFFGTNSNYDRTRRRGIELEAESNPVQQVRLFANWGWMDAHLVGGNHSGSRIPLVPQRQASAGVDWSPIDVVTLSLRGRWIDNRLLMSDWDNAAPGWDGETYAVADAKISYRPLKWLELFAGVNNLLNKEYAEFGTLFGTTFVDYPAPERNYTAGVKITKEF